MKSNPLADFRSTRPFRTFLYSFLASLQFLTILPPLIKRPFTFLEMGNSVIFFPVVGLIIGFMLTLVDYVFSHILPGDIATILTLLFWIIITGALHFDGFLDTVDGLFGGTTVESRLRIMRDEHIGAFALTGGIFLILLKFLSLDALLDERISALLISPTIGRWAMVVCVVGFPYARDQGVGRDIKDRTTWKHAVLATLIAIFIVTIIAGSSGIIIFIFVALFTVGVAWISFRLIKGMTGDLFGAVNELVEVLVLLIIVGIGTL